MKSLEVKVNPNSSRVSISEMADGTVKVNLTASPESGEANNQLIEILANQYEVDPSKVKIERGKTSSRKVVVIK